MNRPVSVWLALLLALLGAVMGTALGVSVALQTTGQAVDQSGGISDNQLPSPESSLWSELPVPKYQAGQEAALKKAGYTIGNTRKYYGTEMNVCHEQHWNSPYSYVILSACKGERFQIEGVYYPYVPPRTGTRPTGSCVPHRVGLDPSVVLSDCALLEKAYASKQLTFTVGDDGLPVAVHRNGTVMFSVQ